MPVSEADFYKWARLAHVCVMGSWAYASGQWAIRFSAQCPITGRTVIAFPRGKTLDELRLALLSEPILIEVLTSPEVKRVLDNIE